MNKVDVILIIIILSPTYFGFKKGFLKSIFSLIGLIAGLFLSMLFHSYLNPIVRIFVQDNRFINLFSFLIIFIVVYFLIIIIAIRISKINKVTKTLDKISGLLLGFFKGLIVASIAGIIFSSFSLFSESTLRDSLLYPKIENIAPEVYKYVSGLFGSGKNDFENKKIIPKDTLKK
ncbi:MAG TPA: CvpA family protein [Ignavibacteria bacterium]